MSQNSFAIVSYAKSGRENYPAALPRLVDTAKLAGFDGQFILCAPDRQATRITDDVVNEPGLPLPSHADIPYGFKPELVKIAKDRGFKKVLWCDSTIVFTRSFSVTADLLTKQGLMVFDNPGCPMAHWTSDDCLEKLGCSPDEAKVVNQVMACVLGFDFESDVACKVFDEWYAMSKDGVSFQGKSGSTRPDFRGHRHDQSAISYLSHKHGVERVPYGFLAYWDHRVQFDSCICNRGINQP